MITGLHAILYANDADKVRAFLRDVLGLKSVDAGHGWLIFAAPPAEIAAHPTEAAEEPHHQLYLMCDDLHSTIKDLQKKGVESGAVMGGTMGFSHVDSSARRRRIGPIPTKASYGSRTLMLQ
ncbi:MAG TPA: VOC family protein [Candidatus Angelobacter sp.]|nr:VOC family protein [Candidatus Angelobacter sp.]